ncbi:uncharacterized protein A4U43_C07F39530 [Asparagus officinalis]|uniref:GDSL esterase/lipase n=1 Tax=Asparagus officinalis TaxID=4686 RepID=A0A5P1EIR9_ASPOF|nr:GDSL esterase/lipase At5g45950-like [Asparagus officinalis]ONK65674.1 uncharacterized protein A4U43_C07F39530 [Asparagus officinalis]
MGCLPVVKTLMSAEECYVKLNDVANSFNSKIARQLHTLRKQLSIKTHFLDVYQVFEQATKHPKKFGFTETTKGCCGSGTIEIGETCKGQTTCDDPTRFMYWDAVHPTQKMYKIIAEEAVQNIGDALLFKYQIFHALEIAELIESHNLKYLSSLIDK